MHEHCSKTLAVLYVANKNNVFDENTCIYCLCSRTVTRYDDPNDSMNQTKLTSQYKNILCNHKQNIFEWCVLKENMNPSLFKSFFKHDTEIYIKKIYIYEFDCIVTMYLTLKDCVFSKTSLIKECSQFIEIQNHNNVFNKFNIYLEAKSTLVNMSSLCTTFKSFILNDKNFIYYYLKSLHNNDKILKYNLLTSRNSYQLYQFDILKNYKLLNYFSIIDYLIHSVLIQFRWNNFWFYNGEAITYLGWIVKYKDYINTNDIYNFSRISNIIKNIVQKQMKKVESEINIVKEFDKSRKFINASLLSTKFKMCYTKSKLNFVIDTFTNETLASLHANMWYYLWQSHHLQQYNNCHTQFKQYHKLNFQNLQKVHSLTLIETIEKFYKLEIDVIMKIILTSINSILHNKICSFDMKLFCTLMDFEHDSRYFVKDIENSIPFFEYRSEKLHSMDSYRISKIFTLMGYSYGNNIKDCRFKGKVTDMLKYIPVINLKTKDKTIKNSKNEIKTTCNTSNNCIYNSKSAIDKDNRKHKKLKCKEVKYSNIQTDLYYNDKENYKHKELLQYNSNSAADLQHNSVFKKYWLKRYQLFSKFDDGIQLDYESWFSVTPEKIAKHIAKRCRCDILIDAFSGAGGNSIHFTSTCQIVYAIDIDPRKIAMTKHNAQIYNVNDKIEYILGDYFCLVDKLIGDVVFLSPPWGGPSYINNNVYDIRNIMSPIGGLKLLEISKIISNNIAFYLPKNINILELVTAGGPGSKIEVEQNFINNKLVAITAYYGNLLK